MGLVDLFIQQGNVEKDIELLQFGDPWSKLVALLEKKGRLSIHYMKEEH